MTTLIHIGFPKTASSFLQKRLFSRHPDIHYPGLQNGDAEFDKTVRWAFNRADSFAYSRDEVAARLAELGATPSGERPFVVSSQGFATTGCVDRRIVAERLRDVFGPAQILLFVREQVEWLTSIYFEHRKVGPRRMYAPFNLPGATAPMMTLEQWFEHRKAIDWSLPLVRFLDYWAIVDCYRDVFGADAVHVIPYEAMKQDGQRVIETICGLLDVDPAKLPDGATREVVNPRLDLTEEAAAKWRSAVPHAAAAARFLPAPVRTALRGAAARVSGRPAGAFSDEQIAWIAAESAPGNERLAQEYGLDLAGYGYATLSGAAGVARAL